METKGKHRLKKNGESEENAGECQPERSSFHSYRNNFEKNNSALERQNLKRTYFSKSSSLFSKQPESKKSKCMPNEFAVGCIEKLWKKITDLQQSFENMSYAEGLKTLKNFSSVNELLSLGGENLICDLCNINEKIDENLRKCYSLLSPSGTCLSLNYSTQPVIGIVYGPTGCGKSQLLRNILSMQLLNPTPETVFFITPQLDMIPPQEITAWKTQICEGNYQAGLDHTFIPQSNALIPQFIPLPYTALTEEKNYDVTHPENIFAQAASKGPIAIIIDECMENLGGHKSIAQFFHAFPSKLHEKFPKCSGYSVLVVLHNMNPRRDLAGNISTLKIQAKYHIISPKMQPTQLNRFINIYTKSLPLPISLLLKDIFNFHQQQGKYDWIIYNTVPDHESFTWSYFHPQEGIYPMYLNVQCEILKALEKIHKVITDRERWRRYYYSNK
ncbi:IVa2 [Bottlenose dolphin adenovirus 1]|uniref:Packaging protein 1 n=1 Tax=Bottlenose dolphin adenovirus 1 TaxID=1714377 RepID=A0A1X7MPI1_9ADEN|nr:IVa2 [Bottlenose dolphin adenovirus 1]SMG83439.1 IVa2 [Bottlenose dolphin adenovirus 1]